MNILDVAKSFGNKYNDFYKVILVDNFDRYGVEDRDLIDFCGQSGEGPLLHDEAVKLANDYNNAYPDDHEWLAKVVSYTYNLRKGEDVW